MLVIAGPCYRTLPLSVWYACYCRPVGRMASFFGGLPLFKRVPRLGFVSARKPAFVLSRNDSKHVAAIWQLHSGWRESLFDFRMAFLYLFYLFV